MNLQFSSASQDYRHALCNPSWGLLLNSFKEWVTCFYIIFNALGDFAGLAQLKSIVSQDTETLLPLKKYVLTPSLSYTRPSLPLQAVRSHSPHLATGSELSQIQASLQAQRIRPPRRVHSAQAELTWDIMSHCHTQVMFRKCCQGFSAPILQFLVRRLQFLWMVEELGTFAVTVRVIMTHFTGNSDKLQSNSENQSSEEKHRFWKSADTHHRLRPFGEGTWQAPLWLVWQLLVWVTASCVFCTFPLTHNASKPHFTQVFSSTPLRAQFRVLPSSKVNDCLLYPSEFSQKSSFRQKTIFHLSCLQARCC